MLNDIRLTNSQMRAAKTCLRRHELAYVHGIRRVSDASHLRMGTAIHDGFDMVARGMDPANAIVQVQLAYTRNDAARESAGEYQYGMEEEVVLRTLACYFWRWAGMDARIRVISSELPFEMPLKNPATGRSSKKWVLAGKIDKIVELAGGRLAIIEHKTTSRSITPESEFWRRLRIDSQVSLYFEAANVLGYPVATILYDAIRKPSLRPANIPILDADGMKIVHNPAGEREFLSSGKPRQSPVPDEGLTLLTRPESRTEFGDRVQREMVSNYDKYFVRQEIGRTEQDIDEALYDAWHTARVIRECSNAGHWPRNTDACIGFGTCPYFDLCANGGYDPERAIPDGYTVVSNVHEELGEE